MAGADDEIRSKRRRKPRPRLKRKTPAEDEPETERMKDERAEAAEAAKRRPCRRRRRRRRRRGGGRRATRLSPTRRSRPTMAWSASPRSAAISSKPLPKPAKTAGPTARAAAARGADAGPLRAAFRRAPRRSKPARARPSRQRPGRRCHGDPALGGVEAADGMDEAPLSIAEALETPLPDDPTPVRRAEPPQAQARDRSA